MGNKEYIALDNLLLVKVELDLVDSENQKTISRAKAAGIAIRADSKVLQDATREGLGTKKGTLVAVGDGAFHSVPGYRPKVGDTVIFKRYAGDDLNHVDGASEWLKVMEDADILTIERDIK